ncbi:MAG: hypothetical protein QM811_32025 [Pirellulales bacterium]
MKKQQDHEAAQARKAEKTAAAAQKPKKAWVTPERLPDGATFDVRYDAAKTLWSGTLTVGTTVITDSASGVFKLLRRFIAVPGERATRVAGGFPGVRHRELTSGEPDGRGLVSH